MKDNLPRYTLRMNRVLLDKLHYIAVYNGRSSNKELEQLVRDYVNSFESAHGAISLHPSPDGSSHSKA